MRFFDSGQPVRLRAHFGSSKAEACMCQVVVTAAEQAQPTVWHHGNVRCLVPGRMIPLGQQHDAVGVEALLLQRVDAADDCLTL